MQFHHRPASIDDLVSIIEIYNQAIIDGGSTADVDILTLEQKIPWFNKFQSSIFIVESDDNDIIAYFYFSPWREGRKALEAVNEISFYVKREFQNQGLGNFILKSIIEIASENHLKFLIAILLDVNYRSKNLLLKYGFQQVGHLPKIAEIQSGNCGQIIMQREIDY